MPDKKTLTEDQIKQVGEQLVKKKRSRPDRVPQTEPGDNKKYINHSLRLAKLGKVDLKSPDNVEERIFQYFQICADDDMKPSVSGLALAMGIDRVYLWELREGRKGKIPAVANLLKKAVQILDLQMTDYMQNGKINPVAGIFLMKNNFGYTDEQKLVVQPEQPLGAVEDPKKIEEKYAESVVIDTTAEDVE